MRDVTVAKAEAPRSWWSRGRRWVLPGGVAVLALVVVFLGAKLAESERQVERLRTELRGVYAEAETLRTQAVHSQQRVAVLEQQVRQLRTERETLLKKLGGRTDPTARPTARGSRASRPPARSGSTPTDR